MDYVNEREQEIQQSWDKLNQTEQKILVVMVLVMMRLKGVHRDKGNRWLAALFPIEGSVEAKDGRMWNYQNSVAKIAPLFDLLWTKIIRTLGDE